MMHRFPTRAAALRSLKDISIDAIQHAKNLITEEDGMFCFDEDTAEQFFNTQPENLENTMTQTINVKTASTKELVEFYNLYVESSIKKFRDRATAERKCQEILDEIAKQDAEDSAKTQPEALEVKETINEEGARLIAIYGFTHCPACGVHLSNGIGHHGQEVNGKVIKHEKYEYECLACGEEFGPVIASKKASTSDREVSATQAETMKTTLKLDRTIIAAPHGKAGKLGEWKNAFQMWKEHTDWMTSAQQDGLTAKLYKAAKEGNRLTITINDRDFWLKNV